MAQGVDVLSRRSGDDVLLQIDPEEPKVKPTLEYALDALADGKLNGKDNDGVRDDCQLLNRKAKPSTRILEVDGEFRGEDVAIVGIRGGVRNPLLPKAWPRLDWDLEIEIDFSQEPPVYRVSGSHDGFPAYEVYVNEELAYGFDPGAPECELRIRTPGGRVALPSYCAEQVRKLGGSLDVRLEAQEGPIALSD